MSARDFSSIVRNGWRRKWKINERNWINDLIGPLTPSPSVEEKLVLSIHYWGQVLNYFLSWYAYPVRVLTDGRARKLVYLSSPENNL
jgi:hypothetical protein